LATRTLASAIVAAAHQFRAIGEWGLSPRYFAASFPSPGKGEFSVNSKLLGAASIAAVCVLCSPSVAKSPDDNKAAAATEVVAAEKTLEVQSVVPPIQPADIATVAVPAPAPPCCKIAALTPVDLEIVTAASSTTSHQGQQIEIRLFEPLSVGGRVVLPAGTTGYAEVIQVSHRSVGGRPGELTLGLPYLTLGGQRIGLKRLRFGSLPAADRTQQAVIAMALVGIAGGLFTGGSVDIKSGTRANAVVTADTFIPVQPESASKE
jgi:hypothetical protein